MIKGFTVLFEGTMFASLVQLEFLGIPVTPAYAVLNADLSQIAGGTRIILPTVCIEFVHGIIINVKSALLGITYHSVIFFLQFSIKRDGKQKKNEIASRDGYSFSLKKLTKK